MISQLLPALKTYLTAECADLLLQSPEKDADGNGIVRGPRVFIGDFPAKREGGPDVREFPCVLLCPHAGYAMDGQEIAEIAAILCVYNPESGDGEGLEMDLVLLQNAVARAVSACLVQPLARRFPLVEDEQGRVYRWQRGGEPDSPRPYAQITLISRWTAPGWQSYGHTPINPFGPGPQSTQE